MYSFLTLHSSNSALYTSAYSRPTFSTFNLMFTEEAPQWREPKQFGEDGDDSSSDDSSDDDDSDDDGELHSRIAALMLLNNELSGLADLLGGNNDSDSDDNDNEGRGVCHRHVRCDGCQGPVYGDRFKCG